MLQRISLLFAILVFVHFVNCASKTPINPRNLNCDTKNNEKIDEKMAKIMVIGEHGRRYPENQKQIKSFCDETVHLLNFADNYSKKCFKGTLRQFSSLFIFSNRNTVKRLCSKHSKQTGPLLKAAKCVNRHMKKLNGCMSKMTENYIGIKYAEDKQKIPFICCEFSHLVSCFSHEMRNTECKADSDIFLDFVRSAMGNFVDSTCGEYTEESDKCTKLGKPPKKKAAEKVPQSILYPLYDIINSLPQ